MWVHERRAAFTNIRVTSVNIINKNAILYSVNVLLQFSPISVADHEYYNINRITNA